MIKKLKRRFLAIAMLSIASMLFVQLFALNFINLYQRDSEVKSVLKLIAENGGEIPYSKYSSDGDKVNPLKPFGNLEENIETPYSTRYFVVEFKGNVVTNIFTEHIAAISDKQAYEYADEVYKSFEPGFGVVDSYRFYYSENEKSSSIVFIDITKELQTSFTLMSVSTIITIITLFFISIPVNYLCKRALRPVEQSMEKQKQFITDAGHELKTPIAIISADADVLSMCEGDNEWIDSIKKQTVRMNTLVKNLIDLSKFNEIEKIKHEIFDISEVVLDTASGFATSAKAKGKSFSFSAQRGIKFKGSKEQIVQLISVLCDNAIKYSDENGTIKLNLYKSGKNIQIDVFNTVDSIDEKDISKLFDRFYRADSSRSRDTGGYGIGLSIAKAITDAHKGKIRAVSETGKDITFKITL